MPTDNLIQNRYELVGTLGQGGVGVVFRASDRLEQQHVALKQVLLPASALDFATKPGTNDTEKLRLSLAHEFSILATLRHPHILSVLDYGFDAQRNPFFTMTLLDGATDIVSYAEGQPDEVKYDLLVQLLQALHYLHRRGILHRDLKPGNVLVTADGQVKVMDFGLAKGDVNSSGGSTDGNIAGTLKYMAPELFMGSKTSFASDLWGFGVMAYEILIGHHPFGEGTLTTVISTIVRGKYDTDAIPDFLVALLSSLLTSDPTQRPASAYDVMQELYALRELEIPPEDASIRESFLQASKFVGRKAELQRLTDALGEIETDNAFFLIGGESGVGKSRLLDELRIRALVQNVIVMRGQAVEGGGLPFQVWRPIVRRLLLITDVSDLQASILKDLVPNISDLLERDIPTAPEVTGRDYQARIVLTVVDLLRAVEQPLLLLLEDLHWAVESLAPLQQILRVRDQLPSLMIVANYRNDEAPTLPQELAAMTHIQLARLDTESIAALSTAMLGEAGANAAVVELLQTQSEGNTFFMIETVRALAEESGRLGSIGAGELPATVFTGGMQAVMQRRLQRVDAQFQDIQTLAAVFGRQLDVRLLEHAFGAERVENWLINAAEFGVVDIQDNIWRFAHDKLRETLIIDMSADAIRARHRHAAEAIEAVYPNDAAYNEALLNHWQHVGDVAQIYRYVVPVVKNMIDIKGMYHVAEQVVKDMLDRLPAEDARTIQLWNLLARCTERQGNLTESQQSAQRAYALATDVDDAAGLAMSLYNLGVVAYMEGKYDDAFALHQQGLETRQELNDQHGVAESLNHMAIVVADQGNLDRALTLFEQSLAIQQELGNKRGIATGLNNLGTVVRFLGDSTRAQELYQQSLAIKQELSDKRGIASNLNNLADIQEDNARAKELYEQSLALNQELGDQRGIFYGFIGLGKIAVREGDVQAGHWYGHALRTAYTIQALPQTLLAVLGLADVLIQRGHAEQAAHLIGFAQSQPAQNTSVRKDLTKLMPLLEEDLSPEALQAALNHGQTLDMADVIKDLLAEFSENDTDDLTGTTSDDKRATVTAEAITVDTARSLDAVLAAAIKQLNNASVDATVMSVEAVRQKLSAAQFADIEAELAAVTAAATDEATINWGPVIRKVVAMLRESSDTK